MQKAETTSTTSQADIVAQILAHRWISLATLAVAPASVGSSGLAIGATTFGTGAQVLLDGDRLSIIRDGWRLESYRRFRPLVYYAAFGRDEVFDCLRIAVTTLFEFGGYDGEVLLLTDDGHRDWPASLPERYRDRVTVRTFASGDMLDWTLARYRIVDMPELRAFRPVLYLDIDIVCNAPIGALLQRLAVSTVLHAPVENPVMTPEDYYGASLLTKDGVSVSPKRPGFSTGVMGFPDVATVQHIFALVPKLAEAYAQRVGSRTAFDCYDQPFTNYAAVKSNPVELSLLRQFLDNQWYWLARPTTRRGLLHLTGGTDQAVPKLKALTEYVSALRATEQSTVTNAGAE